MLIKSNRIYLENGVFSGYLLVEGKKIVNIYPATARIIPDVDYQDLRIIPGIFDTHNHGGFGFGCFGDDLTEEKLKTL